jgi:hypothetical protein
MDFRVAHKLASLGAPSSRRAQKKVKLARRAEATSVNLRNQFVANGPNGGLRSVASVEFSQNVLNVFFNGVEA